MNLTYILRLPILVAALAFGGLSTIVAASFSNTGSMNSVRSGHSATLLINGKVLIAGGGSVTGSTELYNPANGTWSLTGSLSKGRSGHNAVLLTNGKVLVIGGADSNGAIPGPELYDPTVGTWSIVGQMITPRSACTTTLLSNGKILVAGGNTNNSTSHSTLSTAELYDPSTATWAETGAMNHYRSEHAATLLSNGNCLVSGGTSGNSILPTAELYDLATGTWIEIGEMNIPRTQHTATLLSDGKVLIAGGRGASNTVLSGGEIYNPVTTTWTTTGVMNTQGGDLVATLLPTGKVFVCGGSKAELYDPKTGVWSVAGALSTNRQQHTATLLASGKILIAGGSSIASAELYNPNSSISVRVGSATLLDGSATPVSFVTPIGAPMTKTFTITNNGTTDLALGLINKDGANSADFGVGALANSTLSAGTSATFTITFTPSATEQKTATIHIASNVFGPLNPFDIVLSGSGLSLVTDTDGDGLSDAVEFNLSALGFDWHISQVAMVNALYDGANGAGLYTTQQIQTLHVGTPLIARDPVSEKFKLTMSWKKSTNLTNFSDFPVPTGSSVSVSPIGDIEFEFRVPDNAAFFRMEFK